MRNINVITDGIAAHTNIFDCQSGEQVAPVRRLEVIFDTNEPMALGKLFIQGQEGPEDVRVWFDSQQVKEPLSRQMEILLQALGEASALFMSQTVVGTSIVMPDQELSAIAERTDALLQKLVD